ncbi:MAG: DUF4199 domain-containing protein [Pseudomonadota bacterium]
MTPTLRYSLIYGGLASIVLCAFIAVTGLLNHSVKWVATEAFGYSVMLVALSFVFVGVKRYRDVEGGGVIKFWRALGLGLLIALIAGVAYTLAWEIYLALSHADFLSGWIKAELAKDRASGMSAAALAKEIAKFDAIRAAYANPLIRMGMTFGEVAPVGVLVALASAGLLRFSRFLPARG